MPPNCTATNVSDELRCEEEASSLNGLFCRFHSKQCQGLYRGYKLRNARLESLAKSPPSYLAESSIPLANQTFADLKSEATIHEINAYLSLKYTLLDRVIRARTIHHSRFFSMTMDYGHQHYLDSLSNQKFIVAKALQQLERRTAEILYKRQNWFKWVRQKQDEEEAQRESEKKRVKQDNALFKRHWNQYKQHVKELRMKENIKRQEEFLEEAYKERMSLEEEEAKWDPIDDIVEDERTNHIEMINLFLMLRDEPVKDTNSTVDETYIPTVKSATPATSNHSKKSKRKGDEKKLVPESTEKAGLETRPQMRQRLKDGTPFSHGAGLLIKGTVENPIEIASRTAPLSDTEIDQLIEEIAEIKHLLFCRLLLSHASLLPVAIRANSVEEFLNDKDISNTDLRDLCLKMENPGLQEVRDACADLVRGEEEDDPEEEEIKEGKPEEKDKGSFHVPSWRRSNGLPNIWISKSDQQQQKRRQRRQKIIDGSTGGSEGAFFDFSTIDDETQHRDKKVKVRVCGKSIYNYPSEKAMNRGGWLHFSVIAKDSSLFDAVKLCRHWDEFFELSTLAAYQFFPAANWMEWIGDRFKQQHLPLGFISYQEFREADKMTVHHQSGSRGHARRAHAVFEARNFIAAHIKRNDPASRRLIRYLSMQTHRVLLLVRDGKTGRILISPPKDELWLVRQKAGLGRAIKHEWNVHKEVGPSLFEELEITRKWKLGFNDYFDVIVWDLDPGERFTNVYQTVTEMLFKAHRFRDIPDTYNVAAPILKTVTRDPSSHRVREIKPGEDVESVYDVIHDPGITFRLCNEDREVLESTPRYLFYNDVDALEDQYLFPEESHGPSDDIVVGEALNNLVTLEEQGPDLNRFVFDLDTDEDVPERDPSFEDDDSSEDDEDEWEDESEEDDWEDESEGGEDKGDLLDRLVPPHFSAKEEMKTFLAYLMKHKPVDPVDDMMGQYQKFMKRESSKVFKESWHRADLEPRAKERWADAADLAKKMDTCLAGSSWSIVIALDFLDLNPHAHRRIMPDMRQAYAMMALFFSESPKVSEKKNEMKLHEHLIVNQAERVKNLPDRRRHDSNKCVSKEFWIEWDEIRKKGRLDETFPIEWDAAIRPIIAHFYREGIIRNSYVPSIAGQAFARQEPGRNFDFYVDFRVMINEITLNRGLQEPPPTNYIMSLARKFAAGNKAARFAMLRLWSAPHFYPLIIGLEKRDRMAFYDSQGRAWEWKFIPKDMPYSEWSMHQQSRLRIKPFERKFGDRVLIKRDIFLVMGTDEKDLQKLATASTYAIQTDPWRLEVDLWRSFVNIDIDFLEGLKDTWMD